MKVISFKRIFCWTIKYQRKVFVLQELCRIPGALSLSGSRIFHSFSLSGSFQAKRTIPHNKQCGPRVTMCRPGILFQTGQPGVNIEEGMDLMATEIKREARQGC